MSVHRFEAFLLLPLLTVAAGCQAAPTGKKEEPPKFDTQSMQDTGEYLYEVRTDSKAGISFEIRMSKMANDVNCENAVMFSSGSISAGDPATRHFGSSQMGSPHVALYEWHLCFEIDGVTYKAWRGFDPGPNSKLKVNCFLEGADLGVRQADAYLCRLASVSSNVENYGEFALHCGPDDQRCRQFESVEEFELWRTLHGDSGLGDKVALAYFRHALSAESYLSANPIPIFLSLFGRDPSASLIRRLEQLGLTAHPGSEWQSGLGMKVSISDVEPISDGSVSVTVNTYCGPLCASGTDVILVLEDGEWRVTSATLDWIS